MLKGIHALIVGATLICTTQVHATSAVEVDAFSIATYDSSGNPTTGSVSFSGSTVADAEITAVPDTSAAPPGPDGYNYFASGPMWVPVAFGDVNAWGSVDLGFSQFQAYSNHDDASGLYTFGATANGAAPFADFSNLSTSGTFTLAAHTTMVLSGVLTLQEQYANAEAIFALGLDGSQTKTWEVRQPIDSRDFSLVVANTSDAAATGTFDVQLFATSVPEPGMAALMLLGAVPVVSRRRLA